MSLLQNAHALVIGMKYEFDNLDTTQDAHDIATVLKDEALCGYPSGNVTLLTGNKADRKGILGAFKALKEKTDENSSVFLYYSGHGGYELDTFHFIPSGIKSGMSPEEYTSEWITAEEIRKNINALKTRRLIFFMDCCHSTGIASESYSGSQQVTNKDDKNADSKEFTQQDGLAQKVDTEKGISVIASCKENQKSYKMDADQNSLFTKHLLMALKGQHQAEFVDPYVRILQVAGYLMRVIPPILEEIATKWNMPDAVQEPYVNLELYDDFILSYVPKALRQQLKLPEPEEGPEPSAKGRKEVKTVFRETQGANNLLLFIHGFSGEAGDTFGKIPDMLIENPKMDGWDMKPFGYSQFIDPELGKDVWAGVKDVDRIAEYLCTSVRYKFEKYDRIAIVAHSLGGLIGQRAILDFREEYRQKISHLILLGTPSNGVEPEKLKKLWNNKYKEMSSEGTFISGLRNEWNEAFQGVYPFSLRVAGSVDDEFVTLDSCFTPFGEDYRYTIDGRHLGMVKPKDEQDDCYRLILSTLTDTEFANQYTNNEEINIALGKYDAVVKKLMPHVESLDKNGLKRLVFALEGLDRREEALKILDEHPTAQEDTDLMGIIGGRYKRAYLKFPSQDDAETAFVYYELALEKSTNNKNYEQIYYHAINLAFLSLVVKDNKADMVKYAEQALHVAKNCANNLWKYATVAEANMYLNELDTAKKYYKMAAELAGIREKISIHLNAYAGYTSLAQTDNPEDPFVVFLREQFLS
ncbi:MAG: caspase family protein [Flavobacteriaceae bacterium]